MKYFSRAKQLIGPPLTACFILLLLMTAQGILAQNKREVLTNQKILELVKLGLPEEIIVEKIRQSDCQCDTSTDGLTQLKTAKVSNGIIMAMLNAASGGKTYSENGGGSSESTQNNDGRNSTNTGNKDAGEFPEPGIYLREDGKTTAIEPTVYSGTKSSFLGTALTYGIKKAKIRAVVRGKSANLQVNSARPEFYFVFSREYANSGAVMAGGFYGFAASSPAEFIMVTMKVKENSREAVLGEIGAFSASTGAPDKYIREFAFEKIKPGVFKVTPKVDLTAGEYCFYYAGGGGTTVSKVFDFSVK